MIIIPFFTGELVFAAIWLIIRIIVLIKVGKIDWKREGMLLLMYINLAVIFRFTFFPMKHVDGMIQPMVFNPDAIMPFKLITAPIFPMFSITVQRKCLLISSAISQCLSQPVSSFLYFIKSSIPFGEHSRSAS